MVPISVRTMESSALKSVKIAISMHLGECAPHLMGDLMLYHSNQCQTLDNIYCMEKMVVAQTCFKILNFSETKLAG